MENLILGIASGNIEFDMLLTNARLLNVYTERIEEGCSVGVIGDKIAAINPENHTAKKVIDCEEQYLIPGFIDSHMHIETSGLNPAAWAELTLVHGTTTAFCDPMELANVFGEKGIELFYEMQKQIPTNIYIQVPSRVPSIEGIETNGGVVDAAAVGRLLKRDEAKSLGEVSASALLCNNEELIKKMDIARSMGKRINGHYPMPEWNSLNAFVSAGVSDDHESTSYQELRDKLSLGLTVMIREGTIEPNAAELIRGIVKDNLPTDNLLFCTDDKSPEDLSSKGHIDYAVKIAVAEGLDPVKAVKMATLNAAKYYHMEHKIGSITPGRDADMLLVRDIKDFCTSKVFVRGREICADGRLIKKLEHSAFDVQLKHSIHLPENFSEKDLYIISEKENPMVRVMNIQPFRLTVQQEFFRLTSVRGTIMPDIENNILPVIVLERYGMNGNIGKAFARGLTIKEGAIACSMAQEANNLVVCGTNYSDMYCAVMAVQKMNGGKVIVKKGIVLGSDPMPIGGILHDCDAQTAMRHAASIKKALYEIGCTDEHVFSYMIVLTAPSIPELGLTDHGIIDVFMQCIINLIVDDEMVEPAIKYREDVLK